MEKYTFLCGGKNTALVFDGNEPGILSHDTGAFFRIFEDSLDQQIKKTNREEIILSTYNADGNRLVVITKSGLLIFFCFDVKHGHEFISDSKHTLTAIYKTMRVIFSDGKIQNSRCAIEDQYAYNVKDCPASKDAIILVPFDVVLCKHIAIVRVQPPESSSCLVRVVFDAMDTLLDGLPTRQAFQSPDWMFVYNQGILDMTLFQGILLILTHTCMIQCWLIDHDPVPLIIPLPHDRVNLNISSDEYYDYYNAYREYALSPIKWIDPSPDTKQQPPFLIPPEWETVLTKRADDRTLIQQTIFEREKYRPKLPLPLANYVTCSVEECPEQIRDIITFSDTMPNAACPWRELQACNEAVYLLTLNELYVFKSEWSVFIDQKNNSPIYAKRIIVTNPIILVLTDEENNWTAFDHTGNAIEIPVLEPKTEILAVFQEADEIIVIKPDGVLKWKS